jgi:outer membrane protein assembly factor BamB
MAFSFPSLASDHWPHWRGPLANGTAPGANPPAEWSESKNVKWKTAIPGRGHATPVVWGDKIFVLTAVSTGRPSIPAAEAPQAAAEPAQVEDQGRGRGPGARGGGFGRGRGGGGGGGPQEVHQFVVLCVDRATGKIVWQRTAREAAPHMSIQANNTFASASPITDGERLYVSFGSQGIYCYDFDGNLLWERDLGQMNPRFGEGTGPALHDGKLIINWDHEGPGFITALDAKTGETIWKTERDERTTWATPAILSHNNLTQVIVPAPERTRAYDLATGEVIWECGGQARGNVVPVPVVGHGLVFAMSGQQGSIVQAIRYDRTGDITGTDAVAWSVPRNAPHVPSPLLYDDLIYFLAGNRAILSCYDAPTGEPHIDAARLDMGEVYASPVGAAGRVYLLGRDGTAMVLKKGSTLEVIATNKLDDRFDASPVIAGNDLILRGYRHLYCIREN